MVDRDTLKEEQTMMMMTIIPERSCYRNKTHKFCVLMF